MLPVRMKGIGQLAERFDHFIIDQFGVLHDGVRPYDGAPEALFRLKAAGKQILLLSNSGKRSAPNERRLEKLGFPQGSWDHFISSGELAWNALSKELTARDGPPPRCLLISRDGDGSAVEGLQLELVESGKTAEIVLLAASEADRFELDHYRALLAPAAERRVRCYCTNPDKVMLTRVGPRPGAGHLADLYTELGGEVVWIGKPYPEIYRAARACLGSPPHNRIVCVGDSIEHDIAGGARAGFATALVETGISSDIDDSSKLQLFQQHDATPGYVISRFAW
jgi:HAD superfamily hydrolase (TIGR01459 family)